MIGAALSLLLASAAPSAVDAEHEFATMAQTQGQWTAFRAFAAPEAVMFVPEPVTAQAWLADRKDPPVPVMWWPGRSWVACDGSLAVNTGPWVRSGGRSSGTFTTVWKRQPSGEWKWLFDGGNETPRLVAAGDKVRIDGPVCRNLRAAAGQSTSDAPRNDLHVQADGRMPERSLPHFSVEEAAQIASGASADGSVRWEARGVKDAEAGAHLLRVWTWDGARYRLAMLQLSGIKAE
ncbi:MAG: hypothetical protein ACM3YM_02125 [Sphingomonadales bacterium]